MNESKHKVIGNTQNIWLHKNDEDGWVSGEMLSKAIKNCARSHFTNLNFIFNQKGQ